MSDAEKQHEDALYAEAVGRVKEAGKVSVSMIQRSMRLGFSAACGLIDRMEREGVVSPADTLGRRELLTEEVMCDGNGECFRLEAQLTAALQEQERLKEREAECHDLIAALVAETDPDDPALDKLVARANRMLGAEDPDGRCGNSICAQLTAALQEQERLKKELERMERIAQMCGRTADERTIELLDVKKQLQGAEDAAAQITALKELRDKWGKRVDVATLPSRGMGTADVIALLHDIDRLLTAPARGETRQQETKEEIIAEALARMAHDGQKEESTGDPYIKHVERVVAMVEGKARVVAWLHDVLEDSDQFTAGDLRVAGISEPVVDALWLLTRFDEVPYNTYIESIRRAEHPLAIEVKLADLRDHLRPNCPERLRPRYEKAWATLTNQPLPSVSTLDGGETRRDEGRKEARKDEPR